MMWHEHSRARHSSDDDEAFILPLFFKCLETLEVCSRRQRDTGDRFGRPPL